MILWCIYLNHSFLPLLQASQFVMQNKARLIQEVTTVMAIVDSLGTIVHPELYAEIQAAERSEDQMKTLYTSLLEPGETSVRAAFYNALTQHLSGKIHMYY